MVTCSKLCNMVMLWVTMKHWLSCPAHQGPCKVAMPNQVSQGRRSTVHMSSTSWYLLFTLVPGRVCLLEISLDQSELLSVSLIPEVSSLVIKSSHLRNLSIELRKQITPWTHPDNNSDQSLTDGPTLGLACVYIAVLLT